MNFKAYLNNAWATHASNPKQIVEDFKASFSLMETEEDVMDMTNLIVHICGEHLGEWERGSELLKKIKNNAKISDKSAMNRYVAILNLGNNPNTSIEDFSVSDQVRIYSPVASALACLGGFKNAEKLLNKASEVCAQLPKDDPANKALAMAGNNIASKLEEKNSRNDNEINLMVKAANLGRKYWEIAGTWKEVERAEYRLSQTYLKAGQLDKALEHAEECLEIVTNNGNIALEAFFAYEALTLVHKELKNKIGFDSALHGMKISFDSLSNEDQDCCKETLERISK